MARPESGKIRVPILLVLPVFIFLFVITALEIIYIRDVIISFVLAVTLVVLSVNGKRVPRVRDTKIDKTRPLQCPKCGSRKFHNCPGGTCEKPIEGINWLCEKCLNEW